MYDNEGRARLFEQASRFHRVYPSFLDAIIIVQPETVIPWHRRGFRAYPLEEFEFTPLRQPVPISGSNSLNTPNSPRVGRCARAIGTGDRSNAELLRVISIFSLWATNSSIPRKFENSSHVRVNTAPMNDRGVGWQI